MGCAYQKDPSCILGEYTKNKPPHHIHSVASCGALAEAAEHTIVMSTESETEPCVYGQKIAAQPG